MTQGMTTTPLTAAFNAVVKATTEDPNGHLPSCGYTDEEQTCGCAEWGKRLHEALAQALADERERIAQAIESDGHPNPRTELAIYARRFARIARGQA